MPLLAAGALVVLASAAVLVLEVLSTRLVAPYVGLTLETYTAAIGVALAAISVGAWLGGRVSDAVDPRRFLGPVLATAGVLVFAVRPLVSLVGPQVQGGGPTAVLLLTLVAVAAPVVVLSVVPPAVVKLQLHALETTGTVVGRLSALGTLGALAGTFLTGFVLISALPTSRVLLVLGAVLVVVGVALTLLLRVRMPRGSESKGLALQLSGVSVLAATALLASSSPCEYESAYFCARVEEDPGREGGRTLYLDTLRHAYIDLDDPTYLEFSYAQRMADVLATAAPAGEPLRVLHLGGGGFTLSRYVAATRPGSVNRVLELDPVVLRIARRELGLVTGPALSVRIGDARTSVSDEPDGAYDVVVGDAFGSLSVPWHLTTREFLQDLRRTLTPSGVYVLNVIDYPPLGFARAEVETLRSVFRHVGVLARSTQLDLVEGGNYVLVASDRPLPVDRLTELAARRGEAGGFAVGDALDRLVGRSQVLTDDDAPVEQLLTTSP